MGEFCPAGSCFDLWNQGEFCPLGVLSGESYVHGEFCRFTCVFGRREGRELGPTCSFTGEAIVSRPSPAPVKPVRPVKLLVTPVVKTSFLSETLKRFRLMLSSMSGNYKSW